MIGKLTRCGYIFQLHPVVFDYVHFFPVD
jgi:hypothetical protein